MEIFSRRLERNGEQVYLDLKRSAEGVFTFHIGRRTKDVRQDILLPASLIEPLIGALSDCAATYRSASGREQSSPPTQAPPKAQKSLADIRKQFPRAYQAWTKEEDERARKLLKDGAKPAEIARTLGRQPNAIRSRLRLEDAEA